MRPVLLLAAAALVLPATGCSSHSSGSASSCAQQINLSNDGGQPAGLNDCSGDLGQLSTPTAHVKTGRAITAKNVPDGVTARTIDSTIATARISGGKLSITGVTDGATDLELTGGNCNTQRKQTDGGCLVAHILVTG